MASISKVHSGADHGGITLKGVNTNARPMMDPQGDMRTWKQPVEEPESRGVRLSPKQRSNIQNKKTYLA